MFITGLIRLKLGQIRKMTNNNNDFGTRREIPHKSKLILANTRNVLEEMSKYNLELFNTSLKKKFLFEKF